MKQQGVLMSLLQSLLFVLLTSIALISQAAVDIQHWQTSQGAKVYFVENHSLPMVDLSISFAAGSAYDSANKSGVAGITRYLMKLGAAGLSDEVIAKGFSDVGALSGGGSGKTRTSFSLRTLSNAAEKQAAITLFNQVLHQPDFPEAILKREKARIIAGLKESATQPDSIASKAFRETIYGSHPFSRSVHGVEETVGQITRQDCVDFYQQHYTAKQAIISLIGDITLQEAKALSESLATALPAASSETNPVPPVAVLTAGQTIRIAHPASQAHVVMGGIAIARDDPDLLPLYVGNYILGGGGFESRLTTEVREKRGLTYSIHSGFSPSKQRGPFVIGFQTQKQQVDAALKVVHDTLDAFIKEGVTEKELKAAKAHMIGSFPMKIDSNSKILGYLKMIGYYDLPLSYLEEYNAKIAAVSAAQIKAAFQKHLDPNKFVTVIVGSEAP